MARKPVKLESDEDLQTFASEPQSEPATVQTPLVRDPNHGKGGSYILVDGQLKPRHKES